jgi:two-component system, LuxR family, sensor kinase FixL
MKPISSASESGDVLVFIVDDDDDTRSNLRDILDLDGYEIAEASCARALLELSGWDKVSLILLDRKLPDGDPEHLLPRIKQLAPQASVIVVTGYGDVATAVSALRLGAADYIIKPINADALRASIRRELSRQSSERQLQSLFENALDGFVIFDSRDVIVDANPAACTILGIQMDLLVGQNLRHLAAPDGRAIADEAGLFPRTMHSGECRLLRGDGIEIDVEYQATLNFSSRLNLVSLRDVTERKRSEQRALQAERLAAIGETMTALVHESRNALQRSFACLEMLALEVENQPSALDLVGRTQRAQEQLRQLYEEVRQWAAPIHLQRQQSDLSDVWREAWHEVMQVHNPKHVRLVEELSCAPICRVDPAKMGQVFRNVFENAVEVSPAQSVIELRCSNAPEQRNELTIMIRDHGPGLSAEQLARLFEPFFTTKTKGTGLGLAIAKRIVQAHSGQIVASSPAGASIEITIPRGVP